MGLWSAIIVKIIRPIVMVSFRWLYRMEFHGLENIPATGPIILTPNHVTYLDPILIGLPVKRRLFFMTWNRIFDIPGLSLLARTFGAFPVRLEGHDRVALKRTQSHLKAGEGVVIFPEGGRSITGKLEPFKPGAFRIAVRCNTPAIPVTINGAYEIWPPGQLLPRLTGKVVIYYHPAIMPTGSGEEDLKARTQDMLVQVRKSIVSKLDPNMMPEDADKLHATT